MFLYCLYENGTRLCDTHVWHKPKLTFVYVRSFSRPLVDDALRYLKGVCLGFDPSVVLTFMGVTCPLKIRSSMHYHQANVIGSEVTTELNSLYNDFTPKLSILLTSH